MTRNSDRRDCEAARLDGADILEVSRQQHSLERHLPEINAHRGGEVMNIKNLLRIARKDWVEVREQ